MARTRSLGSYMTLDFLDLCLTWLIFSVLRGVYCIACAHVHVLSGVLGVDRNGSSIAPFLYERCNNEG